METKHPHLVVRDHEPLGPLDGRRAWRIRKQGTGKVEKRFPAHPEVIATVIAASQNLQGLSFLLELN